LHFDLRRDGQVSREDLTLKLPEDDLITRAARLLQQASGTSLGAHIAIEKSIPAQAGMGGGSSDAATCLLALNKLWNLNFTVNQLAELGLKLGADVPFFLRGENAWVEGVGEIITPISVPPAQFVVVKPPEGLETAKIFGSEALNRDSKPATISVFAANPFGFGHNDLQPVAQRLCPQISEAIDWLETARLETSQSKASCCQRQNDRLRECSVCASATRHEFKPNASSSNNLVPLANSNVWQFGSSSSKGLGLQRRLIGRQL
jgi:4-diphosphocytidyl-2-C-methyl-D-erythritol kinase